MQSKWDSLLTSAWNPLLGQVVKITRTKCYYQILGIERKATDEEIKRACECLTVPIACVMSPSYSRAFYGSFLCLQVPCHSFCITLGCVYSKIFRLSSKGCFDHVWCTSPGLMVL